MHGFGHRNVVGAVYQTHLRALIVRVVQSRLTSLALRLCKPCLLSCFGDDDEHDSDKDVLCDPIFPHPRDPAIMSPSVKVQGLSEIIAKNPQIATGGRHSSTAQSTSGLNRPANSCTRRFSTVSSASSIATRRTSHRSSCASCTARGVLFSPVNCEVLGESLSLRVAYTSFLASWSGAPTATWCPSR